MYSVQGVEYRSRNRQIVYLTDSIVAHSRNCRQPMTHHGIIFGVIDRFFQAVQGLERFLYR